MSAPRSEEDYPQLGLIADDLIDPCASLDADMAGDPPAEVPESQEAPEHTSGAARDAYAASLTARYDALDGFKDPDLDSLVRGTLQDEERLIATLSEGQSENELLNALLDEPPLIDQLAESAAPEREDGETR